MRRGAVLFRDPMLYFLVDKHTTSERIEAKKTEMEQKKNELALLVKRQRKEERKARNHRISTRGAHMESILPDTIGLSDTRFFTFLEKTVANDFGKKILATLTAEQDKDNAKNAASTTTAGGGTSAVKSEAAAKNSGNTVTQTVIEEKHSDNANGGESEGTSAS